MDYGHRKARSRPITTEDFLLGGRVRLVQPDRGYRVAIDPVLLAAAIVAGPHERILDAGCGAGGAALCLAARIPSVTIVGVERSAELAALARLGVGLNGVADRITVAEESFADFAAANRGRFDQVMTNPPFYSQDRHTPSPRATRAVAHGEAEMDLAEWIKASAGVLRAGGRLTLIHRADRLGEILAAMDRRFGAAAIFPLWPRAGDPASRILVGAIKGRRTPPRLLAGLTLHRADGAYTDETELLLRHAKGLDRGPASA
jgi:tRNA1(Val) A37 N6-methylase TrmN6